MHDEEQFDQQDQPPKPDIVQASDQIIEAMNEIERHDDHYLRWPWKDLDDLVGRMGPGQIWYACAFSGGGKTTFMASAIQRWLNRGKRLYVMPLELTAGVFRTKLACMALGINPDDAHQGRLRRPDRKRDLERLTEAFHAQVKTPMLERLKVDESGSLTMAQLERCCEEAADFGAHAMIIDHIDHLKPNKATGNGYADTTEVNHGFLGLMKTYKMLGIATSQLNNGMVSGGQDHLARYQPPREHHVLMGSKKREVATGMIGIYRPIRRKQQHETDDDYKQAIKLARAGVVEPHGVLEPGVVGINAMKLRFLGSNEGKRTTLGFEYGRVVDIEEKDRYSTADGYPRLVVG